MGSIRRRLEALEELAVPQGFAEWPDWDFQDQLENADAYPLTIGR